MQNTKFIQEEKVDKILQRLEFPLLFTDEVTCDVGIQD